MFRLMYVLLAIVATAAVAAGFAGMAVAFHKPIVRHQTSEIPQPGLTDSSTVADVKGRFASESVPGSQVGLPDSCVAYQLSDGAVAVCRG